MASITQWVLRSIHFLNCRRRPLAVITFQLRFEAPMDRSLALTLVSTFAGNLTWFGSLANLIVARGAQGSVTLSFL